MARRGLDTERKCQFVFGVAFGRCLGFEDDFKTLLWRKSKFINHDLENVNKRVLWMTCRTSEHFDTEFK